MKICNCKDCIYCKISYDCLQSMPLSYWCSKREVYLAYPNVRDCNKFKAKTMSNEKDNKAE